MEPEEIDKLFRDKLANRPALPSPEAWMRIQEQMEPRKKERPMWIYYAAASVVLLLLAGLLYFRSAQHGGGPAIATAPATQAPATGTPAAQPEQLAATRTAPAETASGPLAPQQQDIQPASRVAALSTPKRSRERIRVAPSPTPVQLAKNQEPQETSQDQPAPVLAALPASPPAQPGTTPDLSMVEVKVQRNPEAGGEPGLRDNLNRKGQLLKNIFKQARNLKNGEQVEFASLGVNEERIQEETRELKQKISNVISL